MRATHPITTSLLPALTLALTIGLCAPAHAVGGDETAPPKPTVSCEKGKVYDSKTKTCVDAQSGALDVDDLYRAVRQAAYAGRYDDTLALLAAMPDEDDRTLTYLGFVHRKLGRDAESKVYYTRAIEQNPANLLARSYLGQGMVETGDITLAMTQLRAIRAHGGGGTWAETSLVRALETGVTSSY
jgi:tetratricopeptide (TPR) repeat protein